MRHVASSVQVIRNVFGASHIAPVAPGTAPLAHSVQKKTEARAQRCAPSCSRSCSLMSFVFAPLPTELSLLRACSVILSTLMLMHSRPSCVCGCVYVSAAGISVCDMQTLRAKPCSEVRHVENCNYSHSQQQQHISSAPRLRTASECLLRRVLSNAACSAREKLPTLARRASSSSSSFMCHVDLPR